jgi:hypothetical protein
MPRFAASVWWIGVTFIVALAILVLITTAWPQSGGVALYSDCWRGSCAVLVSLVACFCFAPT